MSKWRFSPHGLALGYALILALLAPSEALSLAPDTLWTRAYGFGTANDVIALADGGFAATGYGWPDLSGNPQIRLLRTDAAGDVVWDRVYGTPPYSWPYAYGKKVFATGDGGFLLAADHHEPFARWIRLLRINSSGDTVWTRSYGSGALTTARKLSDGALACLGRNGGLVSDPIFLRRTDPSLNPLWDQTYSPGWGFSSSSFDETADGGFIIGGSVRRDNSTDDYDAFLIRTNSSGIASWTRYYDDAGLHQFANSVRSLPDGGFVLTGENNDRMWLVRTNSNGDTLWTRTFNDRLSGNDIELVGDEFVVAATFLAPTFFPRDLDVMRLDASGQLLWSRVVGSTQDDEGERILPLADGGYIAAGYWKYTGCTFSTCDIEDFWLVRLVPPGTSDVFVDDSRRPQAGRLFVYPNPLRQAGTITVEVPEEATADLALFDTAGRLVRTLAAGLRMSVRHSIALSAEDLRPGLYYVRLQSNHGVVAQKVLVMP